MGFRLWTTPGNFRLPDPIINLAPKSWIRRPLFLIISVLEESLPPPVEVVLRLFVCLSVCWFVRLSEGLLSKCGQSFVKFSKRVRGAPWNGKRLT